MSHWHQLMLAAIGGGAITSLLTFIPVMFGNFRERKGYEKFMLNEFKKLKDKAEENHKAEQTKRIEAENKLVEMSAKLVSMNTSLNELQDRVGGLQKQLADKHEIEDQFEDLVVSYDNLESEHESLTKKYIELEIAYEKQREEIASLLDNQRLQRNTLDADQGMDASGIPLG